MKEAPRLHRFGAPMPLDLGRARAWLGAKGAAIAQMSRLGLPVPAGFTVSTAVYADFVASKGLPPELFEEIERELAVVEEVTGRRLGDPKSPLLLAVRSSPSVSMPGVLETIVDVGVDGSVVEGLASLHGDRRFALDVRRRFLESYGAVALGVPRDAFAARAGGRPPHLRDEASLAELVSDFERLVSHEAEPIPEAPRDQLRGAIEGVLRSWQAPRAAQHRRARGIAERPGPAVTIQAMVFGNLGERSGAGVAFSRDPRTGGRRLFGEYLAGSQGEDIVSGRRTPERLSAAQVRAGEDDVTLETSEPALYRELEAVCERLEAHFGDAQDVEFTFERGELWVLQCRPAPRTARAAARIAVELAEEGVISPREALHRIDPSSLRQLVTPRLPDPERLTELGITPLGRGLAASPGAATGRLVLDEAAADRFEGDRILVRAETSAEDVPVMRAATGVLTSAGGLTSHAAVVARAMGKPCVTGATALHVDYVRRRLVARGPDGAIVLEEGAMLTIDGSRGLVYAGELPVEPAPESPFVEQILAWADAIRRARIVARVESPRAARVGDSFGADALFVGAGSELAERVSASGGSLIALELSRASDAASWRDGLTAGVTSVLPEATSEQALADLRELGMRAGRVRTTSGPGPEDVSWARKAGLDLAPAGGVVALELHGLPSVDELRAREMRGVEQWLVVPPLDVPSARVLAAQAVPRARAPRRPLAFDPQLRHPRKT